MDAQTDAIPTRPLTHRETRLIVFSVLLPVFMGSLDNTILATALLTIGRDLGGDVRILPWLITTYLLAATACMPLYGKIADIHGRLFALRIALAAYMAGSLICALAPSMPVLLFGRVIHGIGGSGLSSIAVVVLGDSAAPKERGRYYGYFSITYTTAGAIGPALGGFIADHFHWSAIFWINIPLGLLALVATSTVLRRLPRHERPHRLDVIGAILVVVASVSFMLALNLGGKNHPWLSAEVSGLLLLALAVGAGFVLRLVTAPEPLIPIVILREPIVRWSVLSHAMGWAGIVTLNIFLPIYLQSVLGLSPTRAGLSVMVLMVGLNGAAGLSSPLVGRVKRYKLLPMMALVLSIAAVLVLALWGDRVAPLWFELLVLVIGMGFGPTSPVTAVAMQNAVARHQLGVAVGMMNFSRNLFTTILVALVGVIVLGATSALAPGGTGEPGGPLSADAAQAARAFGRMFYVIAAALAISFVALVLIEEKPLKTREDEDIA